MILVSTPLNGSNHLSWSRSIKILVGAKTKLSLIDGSSTPQSEDWPQFANWRKSDYMVLSWLLNSSRDLWLEIEERFGESNGPMIYQIQREINTTTLGDLTVTQYYSRLKKQWDELTCLEPIPVCTCGAARTL